MTRPDWGRDGHPVVFDGQVVGRWRRKITNATVWVEITIPAARAAERDRFSAAASELGEHLGRAVRLDFVCSQGSDRS